MFILYASKTQLTVRKREPTTSGSVNVYNARFEFSPEWDSLERTAIFEAGTVSRSSLLNEAGECVIPWEVFQKHGLQLRAGVYGTRGGEIVLPTVWANLGVILEGVPSSGSSPPPTPELWEQQLAKKGDALGITPEGELGLYADETLLSSVPLPGGGGGAADHRMLSHRGAERQHPIEAIEGLAEELKKIPAPSEGLTNEDLEEILR